MGPPGVAMGAEHQRGEGRPHEKQRMGWGTWGAETGPGCQAEWPQQEQDTLQSHVGWTDQSDTHSQCFTCF